MPRSAARRSSSASPTSSAAMAPMLIPLGRPGTPEEAAGGVFFLCSPWSNYVHGQVLNITGGQFGGMTIVAGARSRMAAGAQNWH